MRLHVFTVRFRMGFHILGHSIASLLGNLAQRMREVTVQICVTRACIGATLLLIATKIGLKYVPYSTVGASVATSNSQASLIALELAVHHCSGSRA